MRYRRGKKFHPSIGSEFEREKRGRGFISWKRPFRVFVCLSLSLSSSSSHSSCGEWVGLEGGRRKMGSSEVRGKEGMISLGGPNHLHWAGKNKKRQAAAAECG